jgi:hypothetical protein
MAVEIGGSSARRGPHHATNDGVVDEPGKREKRRFSITREGTAGRVTYSLGVSPEDVPELVAALKKAGRAADGYAIEAFLVSLSEIGDPAWAGDLEFDSEGSRSVVRCGRRDPLRRLAERLERRLAKRGATRRIVEGLPRE